MEVTFPRIVLAEFNTHRMFSRNSASSRAIPVEKQIQKIEQDPFIPIYWGKNQKGMSADVELNEQEISNAKSWWNLARSQAVIHAQRLLALGVHKQITNRLLEPFMWHTVIVSATEWENFFNLRCHPAAQPEIRKIAEMMKFELGLSIPKLLEPGEWHLPLLFDLEDLMREKFVIADLIKISAGRCARVSYLTHAGIRDPQADIELCNKLQTSGHMSPLEHPAQCANLTSAIGNFKGWIQYRKTIANEAVFKGS